MKLSFELAMNCGAVDVDSSMKNAHTAITSHIKEYSKINQEIETAIFKVYENHSKLYLSKYSLITAILSIIPSYNISKHNWFFKTVAEFITNNTTTDKSKRDDFLFGPSQKGLFLWEKQSQKYIDSYNI
jgi:hypothetical protein